MREPALDLFGHGTREAVIAAVLTALGQSDRFETVAALDDDAVVAEVRATAGGSGPATEILTKVVRAGLPTAGADVRPSEASELPRP